MLEMGIIKDVDILQVLAGQQGLAWQELDIDNIPQEAFDALPVETATTYGIVPIKYDEATHAINLFDMNQKYADVLPLADVLEYLGEVGAKRGN